MNKIISDVEVTDVIDNTYTLYVINKFRWIDSPLKLDHEAMKSIDSPPIYRAKIGTDNNVLNMLRNYLIISTDVFTKTSFEGNHGQFQLELYEYNRKKDHYRLVYDSKGYIVITDLTGFKYKE